jgi:hypothetical protein
MQPPFLPISTRSMPLWFATTPNHIVLQRDSFLYAVSGYKSVVLTSTRRSDALSNAPSLTSDCPSRWQLLAQPCESIFDISTALNKIFLSYSRNAPLTPRNRPKLTILHNLWIRTPKMFKLRKPNRECSGRVRLLLLYFGPSCCFNVVCFKPAEKPKNPRNLNCNSSFTKGLLVNTDYLYKMRCQLFWLQFCTILSVSCRNSAWTQTMITPPHHVARYFSTAVNIDF